MRVNGKDMRFPLEYVIRVGMHGGDATPQRRLQALIGALRLLVELLEDKHASREWIIENPHYEFFNRTDSEIGFSLNLEFDASATFMGFKIRELKR